MGETPSRPRLVRFNCRKNRLLPPRLRRYRNLLLSPNWPSLLSRMTPEGANRYGALNFGGNEDLGRMVSIIYAQAIVERDVEAALVDDGFRPNSILARYTEIRGVLHSPQGELLTERTYNSYVTQIRERGTRQSVPYRRIIRAIQNDDLFLER